MFLLAFALLLLVAASVGGYLYYRLHKSLPQIDGAAALQGLTAPVEVLRDSQGIPHLFGSDVRDLARAMGYVHAQDRYFQMELFRRMGSGRLSELFGIATIEHDRLVRRMGLPGAALSELNRAAPEAREILEAYASGVNAYLAAHNARLPPELEALELVPAPWEAADSLAITKWMAYLLSANGKVEMLRANLAQAVGSAEAYRLTGLEPPMLEEEEATAQAATSFRLTALASPLADRFRFHPGASNAWVVASERSASGRPLLASDPHLMLTLPSIWYEIQLSGGGVDVAGASLPGIPFVIIGRNRRIAWGVTALFADVQDLYLETPSPENPRQYAVGEEFRDLDVTTETIPVRGESPVTEEIRVTRHGVVVGESSDGRLLAQRWESLWSGDHTLAVLRLNRAGSWNAFTEALATWSTPSLSFLYADVEGNIGFFPAGEIPVRIGFDGSFPVDGSTNEHEWAGVIPHELKPFLFNPQEGIIVSANQQMLAPDTPYPLGADTLARFRARRIAELLRAQSISSLDDFARIQSDRYDPSTEPVLRHAVALRPSDERHLRAIELLRNWSGQMSEGPAPAIYQALYRRLLENAFRDELDDDLFRDYLEFLELGHAGGLYAIIDDEASPFWDDRATPELEDRTRVFLKSLDEALASLSDRLGDDMESWDWRSLHAVSFDHPLGAEEPMSWLLSRGPVPFGGSTFTVANAVVSLRDPFETTLGTSFRFLADLADPTSSRSVVPTGASGHPLSPHYFDQNSDWLEGRSHPLFVERSALEGAVEAKLILQP